MKNIIEKRKGQLSFIGIISIALAVIAGVAGIILLITCANGEGISVIKLVFGIILAVIGLAGLIFGIFITWMASSVKATQGSIAEDNLGKGTVNMHKCENCGAEVEAGKTICAKCEENLKP